MHNEYFYDRSPYGDLNSLNELQYGGGQPLGPGARHGCAPTADGFQPCPVSPYYQAGGFGEIDKYSAYRWSGELKSTHIFEAGGHHELKYGWHLDSERSTSRATTRALPAITPSCRFLPGNQQRLPPCISTRRPSSG